MEKQMNKFHNENSCIQSLDLNINEIYLNCDLITGPILE